jgi:hypothetical protein
LSSFHWCNQRKISESKIKRNQSRFDWIWLTQKTTKIWPMAWVANGRGNRADSSEFKRRTWKQVQDAEDDDSLDL